MAWEAGQPVRHELVDGQVHAMGGGTAAHDRIANALRVELSNRLRGKPCRPHGPDMKVQTGSGNARYPDALIDCGAYDPDALHAQRPVAVFEVLSRSTGWLDQTLKLRDYDATACIIYYALVSQDEPRVLLYARGDNGRLDIRDAVLLGGLDAAIDLPLVGLSVPLAALHGDSQMGATANPQ
jgi:Uma2 family endonuclease